MSFKTTCPYCGQRYEVDDSMLNQAASCSKCGKAFILQTDEDSVAPFTPGNGNVNNNMSSPVVAQKNKHHISFISMGIISLTIIACIATIAATLLPTKKQDVNTSNKSNVDAKKTNNDSALATNQQTNSEISESDIKQSGKLSKDENPKVNSNKTTQEQKSNSNSKISADETHQSGKLSKVTNLHTFFVDIGPKQNITEDMGFEDLRNALEQFRFECCCSGNEERFPMLFGTIEAPRPDVSQTKRIGDSTSKTRRGHRKNHIPRIRRKVDSTLRIQKPIAEYGENISYKQKKQMLKKDYKKEISYIRQEYSAPIDPLVSKHIIRFRDYRECWGMTNSSGFAIRIFYTPEAKCRWHTRMLAQRGNTLAQLALGSSLIKTYCNDREAIEGINWLKSAALSGEPRAYFVLGNFCQIANKIESSIECYKKGAAAGDTLCMWQLGQLCLRELRDPQTALQWFIPAAEGGDMNACAICAEIYSEDKVYFDDRNGMSGICENNVKHNPRLSIKYLKKIVSFIKGHKQNFRDMKHYNQEIIDYQRRIEKQKLKIED